MSVVIDYNLSGYTTEIIGAAMGVMEMHSSLTCDKLVNTGADLL